MLLAIVLRHARVARRSIIDQAGQRVGVVSSCARSGDRAGPPFTHKSADHPEKPDVMRDGCSRKYL